MKVLLCLLLTVAVLCALAKPAAASGSASSHNDSSNHTDIDHDHDHGNEHIEDDSATITGLKIMSICVFFASSMGIACIVIFVPSCRANPLYVSIGGCFAAGLFITVGVTHMLGEATMILLNHYGDEDSEHFRHPFIFAVAGYVFMVVLQRGIFDSEHHHGVPEDCDSSTKKIDEASTDSQQQLDIVANVVEPGSPQPDSETKRGAAVAQTSLFATVFALFIHSLIEGSVLGLQEKKEGVILIFIAIITHNWAEDLAVSMTSGAAQLSTMQRLVVSAVEASAGPIGVGVGWALKENIPSAAVGYILAFCTGCFINIACTEVVPHEINGRRSWRQLLALCAGCGVLYLVMTLLYKKEAHDH